MARTSWAGQGPWDSRSHTAVRPLCFLLYISQTFSGRNQQPGNANRHTHTKPNTRLLSLAAGLGKEQPSKMENVRQALHYSSQTPHNKQVPPCPRQQTRVGSSESHLPQVVVRHPNLLSPAVKMVSRRSTGEAGLHPPGSPEKPLPSSLGG